MGTSKVAVSWVGLNSVVEQESGQSDFYFALYNHVAAGFTCPLAVLLEE